MIKNIKSHCTQWLFVVFLLSPFGAHAFTVPALTGPVVDNAGIIPPQLEQSMGNAIREIRSRGGSQLQVLTVMSLEGFPIEQASIAVTDSWKLGSEKEDDGVLLLVALKERRIRIEVGQGLEGRLPDAYARRIIQEIMVPLFKAGHPESAVLLGVMNIAKRTDPTIDVEPFFEGKGVASYRHVQKEQSTRSRIFSFLLLLFFLIIFIRNPWLLLLMLNGGGGGGRYRGGGGGFGGSRGGGWSGGGGGFSGGGASGGW